MKKTDDFRCKLAGTRLRKLLSDRGVTRKDLSAEIGVSAPALSGYTAGKYIPKEDVAGRIGQILGVSADYIRAEESTFSDEEINEYADVRRQEKADQEIEQIEKLRLQDTRSNISSVRIQEAMRTLGLTEDDVIQAVEGDISEISIRGYIAGRRIPGKKAADILGKILQLEPSLIRAEDILNTDYSNATEEKYDKITEADEKRRVMIENLEEIRIKDDDVYVDWEDLLNTDMSETEGQICVTMVQESEDAPTVKKYDVLRFKGVTDDSGQNLFPGTLCFVDLMGTVRVMRIYPAVRDGYISFADLSGSTYRYALDQKRPRVIGVILSHTKQYMF